MSAMRRLKNPLELKEFLKEKGVRVSIAKASDLFKDLELLKPLFEVKVDKKQIKPLSGGVGEKGLLKRLLKIERLIEEGKAEDALIEVVKIRKTLEQKLEKKTGEKEEGKEANELAKWYVRLWKTEGKLPPEFYSQPKDRAWAYLNQFFKRMLEVLDAEEIKELYRFWFELEPSTLPKEIRNNYAYKLLFIAKSGRDLKTFWQKINLIRALKEDLGNAKIVQSHANYDDIVI